MENKGETELVTGADGKTYCVYVDPPIPSPPLPMTDKEAKAVDVAAREMAKRLRRESIRVESALKLNDDERVCKKIDKIIADTLIALRTDVPEDPAEKLFDVIGKTSTDWGDDADAIGILFCRFLDTMEAMISFKKKFRGREIKSPRHGKDEALKILRARGLVRR